MRSSRCAKTASTPTITTAATTTATAATTTPAKTQKYTSTSSSTFSPSSSSSSSSSSSPSSSSSSSTSSSPCLSNGARPRRPTSLALETTTTTTSSSNPKRLTQGEDHKRSRPRNATQEQYDRWLAFQLAKAEDDLPAAEFNKKHIPSFKRSQSMPDRPETPSSSESETDDSDNSISPSSPSNYRRPPASPRHPNLSSYSSSSSASSSSSTTPISKSSSDSTSGSSNNSSSSVLSTGARPKNPGLSKRVSFREESPPLRREAPVLLPCEFCEEMFPERDLMRHQTSCEKNETQQPRTSRLTPRSTPATSPSSSLSPTAFISSFPSAVTSSSSAASPTSSLSPSSSVTFNRASSSRASVTSQNRQTGLDVRENKERTDTLAISVEPTSTPQGRRSTNTPVSPSQRSPTRSPPPVSKQPPQATITIVDRPPPPSVVVAEVSARPFSEGASNSSASVCTSPSTSSSASPVPVPASTPSDTTSTDAELEAEEMPYMRPRRGRLLSSAIFSWRNISATGSASKRGYARSNTAPLEDTGVEEEETLAPSVLTSQSATQLPPVSKNSESTVTAGSSSSRRQTSTSPTTERNQHTHTASTSSRTETTVTSTDTKQQSSPHIQRRRAPSPPTRKPQSTDSPLLTKKLTQASPIPTRRQAPSPPSPPTVKTQEVSSPCAQRRQAPSPPTTTKTQPQNSPPQGQDRVDVVFIKNPNKYRAPPPPQATTQPQLQPQTQTMTQIQAKQQSQTTQISTQTSTQSQSKQQQQQIKQTTATVSSSFTSLSSSSSSSSSSAISTTSRKPTAPQPPGKNQPEGKGTPQPLNGIKFDSQPMMTGDTIEDGIPCEFCSKVLPHSKFQSHQMMCEAANRPPELRPTLPGTVEKPNGPAQTSDKPDTSRTKNPNPVKHKKGPAPPPPPSDEVSKEEPSGSPKKDVKQDRRSSPVRSRLERSHSVMDERVLYNSDRTRINTSLTRTNSIKESTSRLRLYQENQRGNYQNSSRRWNSRDVLYGSSLDSPTAYSPHWTGGNSSSSSVYSGFSPSAHPSGYSSSIGYGSSLLRDDLRGRFSSGVTSSCGSAAVSSTASSSGYYGGLRYRERSVSRARPSSLYASTSDTWSSMVDIYSPSRYFNISNTFSSASLAYKKRYIR